MPIQQVASKC